MFVLSSDRHQGVKTTWDNFKLIFEHGGRFQDHEGGVHLNDKIIEGQGYTFLGLYTFRDSFLPYIQNPSQGR